MTTTLSARRFARSFRLLALGGLLTLGGANLTGCAAEAQDEGEAAADGDALTKLTPTLTRADVTVKSHTKLSTLVPLSQFPTAIPAVKAMDGSLKKLGYQPSKSASDTRAELVSFSTKQGETGTAKLYLQRYVNANGTSTYLLRSHVVSNKRNVVRTFALGTGAGGPIVLNVTKDPIDPTHGQKNPDTAGGCFDCNGDTIPTGGPAGSVSDQSPTWHFFSTAVASCLHWGLGSTECLWDVLVFVAVWNG